MISRFATLGLALIVLCSFISKAFALDLEWRRGNARVAAQFVRIVTMTEQAESSPGKVTRWTRPITVISNANPEALALLEGHLILLRGLGIDIRFKNGTLSGSLSKARRDTIEVHFIDHAAFDKEAKRVWPPTNLPECYGTNRTISNGAEDGRIINSVILIPNDLPRAKLRSCIEEEVTQTLGLLNDSYELVDSLFNDENLYDRLSDTDKVFVGLLYHPDVRVGMSSSRLYRVALAILNDWLPQNRSSAAYDWRLEDKISKWEDKLMLAAHHGNAVGGQLYLQQYRLAKEIEPGGVIEAQGALHLAQYYISVSEYEKAQRYASFAHKVFLRHLRKGSLKLAQSYFFMGSASSGLDRFQDSIKNLKASLAILSAEWPAHRLLPKIEVALVGALVGARSYGEAFRVGNDVVRRIDKDDPALISVLYYLGVAHLAERQLEGASRALVDLVEAHNTYGSGDNSLKIVDHLVSQFKKIFPNRMPKVNYR